MNCLSVKEIKPQNTHKIYFSQKIFGKPTKNRKEDPSMFELLSWEIDGFEKHSFKKDQKFKESTEAYLNMIGKNPWKSESQENFVDYHQHYIDANTEVLHKIQNYIEERIPNSSKLQKKSIVKNVKIKQKKLILPNQDEKKENKYQSTSYMSPKALSNKYIPDIEIKHARSNSGEHPKSAKKIKIKDQTKQSLPQRYGQSLQKNKLTNQDLTKNQQDKLIDHFKQTTRWIPNSSFKTYFGKPPFQNYGRGNTHPIDGGLVYGTYLYSHNVEPHRGKNQPKNIQSYPIALMKAKSHGSLIPTHPRTKPDFASDLSKSNAGQTDHKGKIQPETNNFLGSLAIEVPLLSQMQKFGGRPKSRIQTDTPNNN